MRMRERSSAQGTARTECKQFSMPHCPRHRSTRSRGASCPDGKILLRYTISVGVSPLRVRMRVSWATGVIPGQSTAREDHTSWLPVSRRLSPRPRWRSRVCATWNGADGSAKEVARLSRKEDGLVAFDDTERICLLGTHEVPHLTMGVQRLKGADPPLARQEGKPFSGFGHRVGFFAHCPLSPDFLTLVGEAGKQMRRISFSRPGSAHGFAIDGKGISGRSLAASPDPP